MILHLVFFKFKDEDKEANMKKMKRDLEALEMDEILKLEVGVNYNESERAWDLSLITEFEDQAALDAYQNYPPHVAIKEFAARVCAESAVVDYEK
ncbi:hypothetical protein PM10SUCC1_03300 [Propionigenium maris DSM 9537]|jgi:hypothetical protein|uniref:Stress-response A/B barrel domain-containing protein n=1 Tax=Propionigenium maris DSM 9537 TaxID=1123000 RepID=A0A9W6LME0_9FUSO|nr:Dabb family protein [Propionigenium maris]GLI54815.1 hypothetical protein PM10SUCC1_03300 [Propionigenium maris DSM 9537]